MSTAEEDEWEYEYDDHETEDFYVPIDLANVPETQGPVAALPKAGHPVLMKTRLRANHERREAEINSTTVNLSGNSESVGQIQLSGLHTQNPLAVFEGHLLSCEWARNVGTNMFFAKPLPASEEEVLRKLPGVELLATGSAKLIARDAQMRPREDLFEGELGESPEDPPVNPLHAAQNGDGSDATAPPSSFLDRLNAVKAKRGEKSRLVVSKEPSGVRLAAEKRIEEPSRSADGDTREDVDMVDA